MRDHPEPGPPWVPEILRGMLTEFSREIEQEAFAELQFRLPAPDRGPALHGARFPAHEGAGLAFARPPLSMTGAVHPPGFGMGPRPRGLGHV